jgi:hypothetical protein
MVGAVAQLVEQRTENPCVGGSIPPHTTSKLVVNQRVFTFLDENSLPFFIWGAELFNFISKLLHGYWFFVFPIFI